MLERAPVKAIASVDGLFRFMASLKCPLALLVLCTVLCAFQSASSGHSGATRQENQPQSSLLSPLAITELKAKAESGDAEAETTLAQAYRSGNGVPQNESLAAKWFRRAADQGFGMAENNLGTMYRLGEGVERDKEEAVRWYQKAARHGSREGMFNLGTCYYNGDGIGSNEFTAYAWFLVAEDIGNPAAKEAVQRSAATMSVHDKSAAYLQIAGMYEKGEELPKNEAQTVRWLRKAADMDSLGKLRLAMYLVTGPEGTRNYPEALGLCKAASKDYAPALPCVGFMYRKGLGVPQDSVEAFKWYQKGAASLNELSIMVLAEMYSTGEGTKVDRPAAFMLLFRAAIKGVKGAKQKASDLLRQMTKPEIRETEKKLREMNLDPKKAFEALQAGSPS